MTENPDRKKTPPPPPPYPRRQCIFLTKQRSIFSQISTAISTLLSHTKILSCTWTELLEIVTLATRVTPYKDYIEFDTELAENTKSAEQQKIMFQKNH